MRKYTGLLFAGLLFSLFISSAAPALERRDILLYAPFDGSPDAEIAAGDSKATVVTETSFEKGLLGQALVFGGKESHKNAIEFASKGNILAEQGTVAFWYHQIDWLLSEGKGYHFFRLPGVFQAERRRLEAWTGVAYFAGGAYKPLMGWLEDEKDIWHHLAFTWQPGQIALYTDGERAAMASENVKPIDVLPEVIGVGTDGYKHSSIDELFIFKRALTPEEIKAVYEKAIRRLPPPSILAPYASSPPVIDGKLDENEWKNAAGLTGLIDTALGIGSDDSTSFLVTYDDANLYLAMHYPIPEIVREDRQAFPTGALKRSVSERDGDLLKDDAFEITVAPGDAESGAYRFITNAVGALFDSKDGDAQWNADWQAKSTDDDYYWNVEVAIPFSELSVAAPGAGATWGFNLGRTWRITDNKKCLWAFGPQGHDSGRIVFGEKSAPAAIVKNTGDFSAGLLDFEGLIINSEKEPKEFTVQASIENKVIGASIVKVPAGGSSPFSVKGQIPPATYAALNFFVMGKEKPLFISRIPFVNPARLELKLFHFPREGLLEVEVTNTQAGGARKDLSANIRIADAKSKKTVLTGEIASFDRMTGAAGLDVGALPVGKYDVLVELVSQGKLVGKKSKSFERKPLPEWWNNKLGLDDKVPHPWEPIKYKGMKARPWGRQYDFKDALILSQVTSGGHQLLAEPVRLVLTEKGKETVAFKGTSGWLEKRASSAKLRCEGKVSGFDVSVDTLIEYDGFTWSKITFDPGAPKEVEKLLLEVRVKPEEGTMMYDASYRCTDSGFIKPGGWSAKNFTQFQWIGNDFRGIQWYGESPHNWRVAPGGTYVEIKKEEGATVLRLYLIDHKVTIEKPFTITFGLQATPVKPRTLKRGWRYGLSGGNPTMQFWCSNWSLGFNYPVPIPPDDYTFWEFWPRFNWVVYRHMRGKGNVITNYVTRGTTSAYNPEYKYWGEEWRVSPQSRPDPDYVPADSQKDWWKGITGVCARSSWTDFWVWRMFKTIKEVNLNGIYYDNAPMACANTHHGCGYIDENGELRPYVPLLEWRRYVQRIWAAAKNYNRDFIIVNHMSGANHMPYMAFCDVMYGGEEFASGLQQQHSQTGRYDMYDFMKLDRVRVGYVGHNWGPEYVNLLEFGAAFGKTDPAWWGRFKEGQDRSYYYRIQEHMQGIALIHDFQALGNADIAPVFFVQKMQNELGWDEKVTFIPYWDNADYVRIDAGAAEAVVCSIFDRGSRKLLAVMNNSDTPATVRISLNLKKLGLTKGKFIARDPKVENRYEGKPIKLEGNVVSAHVLKRNFRCILIEPLAAPAAPVEMPKMIEAREEDLPRSIRWEKDGSEMVLVPAGLFTMGAEGYDLDEMPVHKVFLESFYIDKYEVTNALYKKFCDATGRKYPPDPKFVNLPDYFLKHPRYPVVNVTWKDAQAYAEWAGKRLPTEAEWEKAARGTDGRKWPWGDEFKAGDRIAWYGRVNDTLATTKVGSFPTDASPYGALDMAGNVCEWVVDRYARDYYARSPYLNPAGPNKGQKFKYVHPGKLIQVLKPVSSGKERVYRGGSCFFFPLVMRTSTRFHADEKFREVDLGFRCAMDVRIVRMVQK